MHTIYPQSSSGRIFLLGAGASSFAGYPLASNLLTFIRDFQTLEARTKEIASRVLEKLSQAEILFKKVIRDPNRVSNLEELLTYLELYHSFPGTIFAANPWDTTDSSGIRRLITEKFLDYQFDLGKMMWENRASANTSIDQRRFARVTEAWSTIIKPGDTVLTFNWDILHEIIFWRAGLWSYRDGYGFCCGNQGDAEHFTKVLVLKLHGSVNWVQENPSDTVREIADVASFFPKSRDSEPRNHQSQAQRDSGRSLCCPHI